MTNENNVTSNYRMAVASATASYLQNARASEDGTVTVDQSYLAAVIKCLSADERRKDRSYESK